jgi:hypothetical protein
LGYGARVDAVRVETEDEETEGDCVCWGAADGRLGFGDASREREDVGEVLVLLVRGGASLAERASSVEIA